MVGRVDPPAVSNGCQAATGANRIPFSAAAGHESRESKALSVGRRRHVDLLRALPELLARHIDPANDAAFCTGSNDIDSSGWFSRLTNRCA